MIRVATPDDKDAILKLIKEFCEEYLTERGVKFDYDVASKDFDMSIKLDNVITLVLENGEVDGVISAFLSRKLLIGGNDAQELVWYVRPGKRREGIKLLKELERICTERGCENLMMIGLAGTTAEDIYPALGYKRAETTYIKKLGG